MHPAINFLPWRLRRAPHRPAIVVTAHDLLPPYLFPKAGPLRQWVTRRLLADADAVVVTNEDDYFQIGEHWGLGIGDRGSIAPTQSLIANRQSPVLIPIGSNIAVAPGDTYDRAAWRARLQVGADETLLAYFGLISRSKGLDTLLDALARLPAHFRLLVIGGAATAPEDRVYADAIRQQIERLGLERRVTVTGHCPAEEVSAHLLAADIAALPFADGASFRRGSLLAALAHGLPVVTTIPLEPRTGTAGQPRTRSRAIGSWFSVLGSQPGGWRKCPARAAGGCNGACRRDRAAGARRAVARATGGWRAGAGGAVRLGCDCVAPPAAVRALDPAVSSRPSPQPGGLVSRLSSRICTKLRSDIATIAYCVVRIIPATTHYGLVVHANMDR